MRDSWKMKCGVVLVAFAVLLIAPAVAAPRPSLQSALRTDLTKYLSSRGTIEHISAASLSISLTPASPNIDVAAGTTTYGGKVPVTTQSLFQIGSNTKAFTAVLLLQLEAQGKLNIEQRVGTLLPQYPAWKNITIHQLLDMTSGIPTYDNVDAVLAAYARNPTRFFSTEELAKAVYPQTKFAPGKGWLYSNTAYLLSQMIAEKLTGHDYAYDIYAQFINGGPRLTNTYYFAGVYPSSVQRRMAAGYFNNRGPGNAALAPLLERDVRPFSMSWAQGAGGIVSDPHALTQWVRALYAGPMLGDQQRRELMTIVSNRTGKPIASTSLADPMGFGLGVGQLTKPGLGQIWYYEGETLGYRMLYAWFPKSSAVIAVGLNSQPDNKQDGIGKLLTSVVATLHAYGKM